MCREMPLGCGDDEDRGSLVDSGAASQSSRSAALVDERIDTALPVNARSYYNHISLRIPDSATQRPDRKRTCVHDILCRLLRSSADDLPCTPVRPESQIVVDLQMSRLNVSPELLALRLNSSDLSHLRSHNT